MNYFFLLIVMWECNHLLEAREHQHTFRGRQAQRDAGHRTLQVWVHELWYLVHAIQYRLLAEGKFIIDF